MPFYPPPWVPKLPFDPPDTVSIPDFMLDENSGRMPFSKARNPFTCGLSGKTYSAEEQKQRVGWLARGLAKEMGWISNRGSEWDKIAAVFSLNTIDTITTSWAIHSLGGICSPANAAYSAAELEHQLRDCRAKCVFTCLPLLEMTIEVVQRVGISKEKVYILELPTEATGGKTAPREFKTVDDLISIGKNAPNVEKLKLGKGEGARRTAYLCYSSGTSGLPKGVMISHRNVIANTMQFSTFESYSRKNYKKEHPDYNLQENALGLLPFSHIYALVLICHASLYQGDGVIVLPKFELPTCLAAVQKYKINLLYIVPPILILFTKNRPVLSRYDLTSVKTVFTGAAPLGSETAEDLKRLYPHWDIRQAYGLTETCTVVTGTGNHDIWFGSSGSLMPGFEAKVMTPDGKEITEYDTPGELWAKSPSVVLGYLGNQKATRETFVDGFMKTGDEVVVRKSPQGFEHFFVVDRIKELIKVKGHQVAPAELEAHLLTHPAVGDCAVIPIPDDAAGEVPKAFVVLSNDSPQSIEHSERLIKREIARHVEKHKARHKWLKGGVEFVDVIPKSPSGKILRRLLRDKEREKGAKQKAKL